MTTEPPGKPAGNDVAINCAVSHTQKQFVNGCLQSLGTLRRSLNQQEGWKPTSSYQCLQLMMGCPAGQKLDPLSRAKPPPDPGVVFCFFVLFCFVFEKLREGGEAAGQSLSYTNTCGQMSDHALKLLSAKAEWMPPVLCIMSLWAT